MGEPRGRCERHASCDPVRSESRFKPDPSESNHNPDPGEKLDLFQEERMTGCKLLRERFIGRRGAPKRSGDVAIGELQPVSPVVRPCLVGETGFVEGAVEPFPAPVPREHPPGPIAAMCCRREADDKKARDDYIARTVVDTLEGLGLKYPKASKEVLKLKRKLK